MEQNTRYQVYKACPIPGTQAFLSYYEEGEVDKRLIQATLDNALLGKKFDSFCTINRAGRTVINLFEHSKKWSWLQDTPYTLSYTKESPNQCNVYWKKMWLGSVVIHKKKGKWVRGFFGGGSYEWEVSSIEINGFEDIAARVTGIEAALDRKRLEEQRKVQEACEIYQELKEMFPDARTSEIDDKIKYLSKNIWEIAKRFKE